MGSHHYFSKSPIFHERAYFIIFLFVRICNALLTTVQIFIIWQNTVMEYGEMYQKTVAEVHLDVFRKSSNFLKIAWVRPMFPSVLVFLLQKETDAFAGAV